MKIYRVAWEQRAKLACHSCCTAEKHPWGAAHRDCLDLTEAEKAESRIYDMESYEVRNVRIEYAETTEWSEYHSWEHEGDKK